MPTARWQWVMAAGTLLGVTAAGPATAQSPPGQPIYTTSGEPVLPPPSSPYGQVTPSGSPPKRFLQLGTATAPQIELVAPSRSAPVEPLVPKRVLVAEGMPAPAAPEIQILPAPRSVAQPTVQFSPGNAAVVPQPGVSGEAAPEIPVSAAPGASPGRAPSFLERWKQHVKGVPEGTHEAAPAAAGPTPDRAPSFWQRCKRNLQECFLGFPEEFEAPPLGASVAAHYKTHVANGDAARMVLYHYDFVEGSDMLNLHGRDKLAEIGGMLPHNFFPIVVERTPACPHLAEARRVMVLNELTHSPFRIPAERVVIGPPIANGMLGVEAEVVYTNQISQVQSGGSPSAGGGVGGGQAILGSGTGAGTGAASGTAPR
jgi:hypothetical protein